MAVRDGSTVNDGFFSLEGGMNSGISPSLLPQNQCAFSVNVTFRRGFPRTRPRFNEIKLNFQGEAEMETWWNEHFVSGSCYYLPPTNVPQIVACCGGRFFTFLISGNEAVVMEATPVNDRNDALRQITWFCQAAQFLVAQNGIDRPWIYDGSIARRSNIEANEVPVGRQMAYINQRLFVVSTTGREILPGDLAGVTPTSVLQFNEILLSATDGGQPLSLPLEAGPITALIPTAQLDTQYGQGILLAATKTSVCSFNPVIQRLNWDQIQLQNIALIGNGFTSDRVAIVNGDVWGRSLDGWRSFIMARRDFSTWGNTPQSQEILRLVDKDTQNLLEYSSFVYFDNRLIGTCSPIQDAGGVYHRGMIALDFESISGLTSKNPPKYDGLWTGINPYSFIVGEFKEDQRCLAFTREGTTNKLWEVTKEYGADGCGSPIQALMELKSFTFKTPALNKELQWFELWIDQLRGEANFDLKFRPNQFPCWFEWKTFSVCSKTNNCDEQGYNLEGVCITPKTYEDGYNPRIPIGVPPSSCVAGMGVPSSFGYEFQLRIAWTGSVRLKTGILYATFKEENPITIC